MTPSVALPIPVEIPLRSRLWTALGLALDSIRAHRLRSFLTLLGVTIGVASVIIVGAAIEGLGVQTQQTTEKAFGSESFLVAQIASVGRLSRKELADKFRYNRRIRPEDYEYLRQTTGDEIIYSPYAQRFDDAEHGEQTLEACAIIGTAASLPDIRDVGLLKGRYFTDQEERSRAFVAIVGDDIKTKLFAGENPIGKKVRLKGYEFLIIGLQERFGSSFGRSQDNSIYVPFGTFGKLYTLPRTISVFARPRPETKMSLDDGLDVTRSALRTRFHTRPGAVDNFDFLTPDSIRGFIDNILGFIRIIVVPVTAISLIVGGIVIMNIMLVSVTERTREIGTRMSLGARRSDILYQFVTEAIITSAAGGIIGILLGYGASRVISEAFGATLAVTPPYVILALVASGLVGIVSGWYPAWRASKLDPIAALRAES